MSEKGKRNVKNYPAQNWKSVQKRGFLKVFFEGIC